MNAPRLFQRLLKPWAAPQLRQALATAETDNTFAAGSRASASSVDRFAYDRQTILQQALEAWRVNPIARRLVGLTSQYVVGGGVSFNCAHPATAAFLHSFWEHPLNRLPVRLYEWCDELTRSGNLFLLLTTDPAGMSYVRAVPSAQVKEILSRPNDIDQETHYAMQPDWNDCSEATEWLAYDPHAEQRNASGGYKPVMLHYAINRAAGAQWGESDLAPILKDAPNYQ